MTEQVEVFTIDIENDATLNDLVTIAKAIRESGYTATVELDEKTIFVDRDRIDD